MNRNVILSYPAIAGCVLRASLLFLVGLLSFNVLADAQSALTLNVRITFPDNEVEVGIAPSPIGAFFVSDNSLFAYRTCKARTANVRPAAPAQANAHFFKVSAGLGPTKIATVAASTPFQVHLTPKRTLVIQSGTRIEAFDTNFKLLGRYDLDSKYASVHFSPSGRTVLVLEYLNSTTRFTFLDGDTVSVRSTNTASNCLTDDRTAGSFSTRKRHIESISDTRVLFTFGGSEHFAIPQQELCTGSKGQHLSALSGVRLATFVSEDLILSDFLLHISRDEKAGSLTSSGGRIHNVRSTAFPKAKLIGHHTQQNAALLTWGEFRDSRGFWSDDDPVLKRVSFQLYDLATSFERGVLNVNIDPQKPFVSALSPNGETAAVLNGDLLSVVQTDLKLP